MINVSTPRFVFGWISAALGAAICGACASDSEIDPGTGGTGSTTGGASATGGTSGAAVGGTSSGGSSSGGGGSSAGGSVGTGGATGGTGGATGGTGGGAAEGTGGVTAGTGGGAGDCAPRTQLTFGVHVVLNVTWPDTLVTVQGADKVHIWSLSSYAVNGNEFSGETRPCGSIVPPLQLSAIAGGGKAQMEVPDATWELSSVPKTPGNGTIEGWTVGSRFTTAAATTLTGLTMDDPTAPWPDKGNMIMAADHDNDMKPGILAIPKSTDGFVLPPVTILGQAGPVADQVHLAVRITIALEGALTSCTDQAGPAVVQRFDNHVVGCHVLNGADCDATQADFIDTNRTIFVAGDASYTGKFMDEGATCADVRAALP